jgi:hypothetical protein
MVAINSWSGLEKFRAQVASGYSAANNFAIFTARSLGSNALAIAILQFPRVENDLKAEP